MRRMFWVRHGPTHAKAMVGWADVPADLSDTAQIQRLSDYLPDEGIVISSDLQRASATADVICNGRARLPHDPDLREINFGDWDMQVFDEIEDQEKLRLFWDEPGDVRAPNGETWNEVYARVSRATNRLIDSEVEGDLIIVAHFGAILTQVQRALSIPAYDAFANRIDNLSVTEIHHTDQGWDVGSINHRP
ncbi:MAG: histidine phosphatase family protein [Pseudomonadota bacterium]